MSEKPALAALSQREYNILRAISARIVPAVQSLPGLDVARRIDEVLAEVRPQMRREFRFLLSIFEYGAPLLGGGMTRFTRMSQEGQDRYLRKWERSALAFKRMGFTALKRSVLAAYYGSELTWTQIGYRGPWLTAGYPYDYAGTGIQIR